MLFCLPQQTATRVGHVKTPLPVLPRGADFPLLSLKAVCYQSPEHWV